jgi:hypothetical protein
MEIITNKWYVWIICYLIAILPALYDARKRDLKSYNQNNPGPAAMAGCLDEMGMAIGGAGLTILLNIIYTLIKNYLFS